MRQERVRVLVADDHPVYREGIVCAINERPDLELVGDASSGREALETIRELKPAVAVLDMKMPDIDGLRMLNAIDRDGLPTRVVFVSAYVDSEIVRSGMGAGAKAYLSKASTRDEICDAIVAVAHGRTVLPPEIRAGLAGGIQVRSAHERQPLLTPREQEVLKLTADGLSAPDIGRRLYLSPSTVKTHLQHLYEKLGVSDRAAAVATAMRGGLLE
jgi:two-component system nitrate/nitrite response regulator NarL